MHGGDLQTLEAQLRDLVRKEFLFLETDPRSPQRGQHGFVQGLISEVAYGTLSRRDRSAKHLVVARHLESLGDEELTGLVAAHYVEAHRATPEAEAETIAVGARDWLSRAGRRALSLGSPEQALDFFEQGLNMTADGTERAALLEAAGEAAERATAYDMALAHFEEAIAHHEAAGDANSVGRATAGLARVLEGLNRYAEAIKRSERAFDAVGDDGDERVRADLACELTQAHGNSGSPELALQWSETALGLSEKFDDIALLIWTTSAKAYALFNLGRHREAVMLARGMVGLAEASGSLAEQALAQSALGLLIINEDPRAALSATIEAAELARRAGKRLLELWKLGDTAEISIQVGEWSGARAALTEVEGRELPPDLEGTLACHKAMLAALTGDTAEAVARLEEASEHMAASEFLAARTTYSKVRSLVSLASGDLEAARRESAEAVSADPLGVESPLALAIQARACLWMRDAEGAREVLSAMGGFRGRWMAAMRRTSEAGLAALEGRVEAATEAYREAIEAWRALDCTLDLALCELDLVLLLGSDHPDATAGKEARDIFTELGAKPFLERLNRAAGFEQPEN